MVLLRHFSGEDFPETDDGRKSATGVIPYPMRRLRKNNNIMLSVDIITSCRLGV